MPGSGSVSLAVQLLLISLELADSGAQTGEFLLGRLAIRWRVGAAPGRRCTSTPAAFSHADNVASMIPRSAAMPTTVAPGVDRYSSTASRRNSSEYVFLATI